MNDFSHLNSQGEVHMVDISDKVATVRIATAQSRVRLNSLIVEQINSCRLSKGDLFATARIAAIQGAKKCAELIPLCHLLPLDQVSVDFTLDGVELTINTYCRTESKTGVEMEALTAAMVAALTIYDMCKAIDKGIVIESTRLISKTGGKSGDWAC